jgi:hypothetical protein
MPGGPKTDVSPTPEGQKHVGQPGGGPPDLYNNPGGTVYTSGGGGDRPDVGGAGDGGTPMAVDSRKHTIVTLSTKAGHR